jgi:phospho-N-acetylmuramoyl-pentapeptide-transferase
MLYLLLYPLHSKVGWLSWLRVLGYPSFRIVMAFATALALGLVIGPRLIAYLRWKQHGISNVREDTPESHQKKKGTPTLGGLLILFSLAFSTLLFADLHVRYIWAALLVTLGYGLTGYMDDYLKLSKRNSKGLPGRYKLVLQTVFFLVAFYGFFGDFHGHMPWLTLDTHVTLPFVPTKDFNPDLGWLYVPFAFFVVVGTSNAVNLTDGLDGLATGPTAVSAALFTLLSYLAGVTVRIQVPPRGTAPEIHLQTVADYLQIPQVEGAQELAIFAAAIAGAAVAFLWFNTYPAEIFMGDVGALALGGALGMLAVFTKNEVMSAIVHGVFLTEALSVMVQVASFKMTGKRVFRMAPIHHHFEKVGWAEPKIIVRFWIISIMLAIVGIASLKLR